MNKNLKKVLIAVFVVDALFVLIARLIARWTGYAVRLVFPLIVTVCPSLLIYATKKNLSLFILFILTISVIFGSVVFLKSAVGLFLEDFQDEATREYVEDRAEATGMFFLTVSAVVIVILDVKSII